MKKLFLFLFITGIMVGCSSTSSSPDGPVTELTYEIDPEKESYTEGEQFVITATITGESVVNNTEIKASFSYELSGCGTISSFPTTDDTSFTYTAGQSGCTITVTVEPNYQSTINGVEQVTGTANFTIKTP